MQFGFECCRTKRQFFIELQLGSGFRGMSLLFFLDLGVDMKIVGRWRNVYISKFSFVC